jgi:hypothetical protein
MKTKTDIIQKLLDERKITVQEAMLLMETEKQYIPTSNPQPYIVPPIQPGLPWVNPIWYFTTTSTTCDSIIKPKENHEPMFGC